MHISFVGAGAAGCFAAIQAKLSLPYARVTVYESQQRALAKVAITGGGRCNLTNSFAEVQSLESVYPRGARLLKRLFREFDHHDTFSWFEKHGVRLVTQPDQCVFPYSQNAMEIVHTLLEEMKRLGVELHTGCRVSEIRPLPTGDSPDAPRFSLSFANPALPAVECHSVVVTSGGHPRMSGFRNLATCHLDIISPVPSLFSLCLPENAITMLMGTVVNNVTASVPGTKIRTCGPLLITHWGVSGPAILKLSSHAARLLHEKNYKMKIALNWMGETNESEATELLMEMAGQNPQKLLANVSPPQLNARLWAFLLETCNLRTSQRWGEIGRKGLNRLAATLTYHVLPVDGKNRFKEEFVTCGGVSLGSVNPSTLESREHPGLYFAGEVLDIDAVTGGFNLQAAWTTGYVVAKALAKG